ncbi:MAG: DUF790 family protein, partial [Armatimonadota bacterium]
MRTWSDTIPNVNFTHVKDGRAAHLEIIGFWAPSYLARKPDKPSRVEGSNVVIAVPDALNCSDDALSSPVVL